MRNSMCRPAGTFGRLLSAAPLFAGMVWLSGCASLPLGHSPDAAVQRQRDLRQASRLRGLPMKGELAIERESQDRLVQGLAAELEKPENKAFLDSTGLLLQQLRVIRKEEDLKPLFLKVMGQQVAAYYDPEKKRVAYVEGAARALTNSASLPIMDRFVYVHEFCHAVEDSNFDIERLTRESLCDFDRNLAVTSLIEGDAMLVGMDSLFAGSPGNTATPLGSFVVSLVGRMDVSDEMETMGDCPAFLCGALVRPYLDGAIFSNRIRREAGWTAIDSVYRNRLPATTAEILFPERKYFRGFEPVSFLPAEGLFGTARGGVSTNRVGAMGIGLWLGGKRLVRPDQYESFLKGWKGDQIYFLKDADGGVDASVWVSCWERTGQARAFCKNVEKRLASDFQDAVWRVKRDGRMVAVVWCNRGGDEACGRLAEVALASRVDGSSKGGGFVSWLNDWPWPIRFKTFDGYSSGIEVLGGHVLNACTGEGFMRFNVADGLILRAESNPDRHYWGTLGGLVRYTGDERSDYTFWKLPLVASWFRRGNGSDERYEWRVLWGLAGYGNGQKVKLLLVPVWHASVSGS